AGRTARPTPCTRSAVLSELTPSTRPSFSTEADLAGLTSTRVHPRACHRAPTPAAETRMHRGVPLRTVGQAMSSPDHSPPDDPSAIRPSAPPSSAAGRVPLATLRRLVPYVRPYRAAFVGGGLAALAATLAGLAMPLLTKEIVDG